MINLSTKISNCCLCGESDLHFYDSFLESALANNLEISASESLDSRRYPLDLATCNKCGHLQLAYFIDPSVLFSTYNYQTGISSTFRTHFQDLARLALHIADRSGNENPKVLDIGSNDGCLLDIFKSLGCHTYGVEPAHNLNSITSPNHKITQGFFSQGLAKSLISESGHFDIITANNVLAHTRSLADCFTGISSCLRSGGIFIFEVQYALPLLRDGLFDMIYHEHTSYHFLDPIVRVLPSYGLYVFHAEIVQTHGGSLRIFASNDKTKLISDNVNKILAEEALWSGSMLRSQINKFQKSTHKKLRDIACFLSKKIRENYQIVGLTAPAKATTLLNNLPVDIVSEIEYVVDDASFKVGKYIPGTQIQVISRDNIVERSTRGSTLVVIFSWNLAAEMKAKADSWSFFGNNAVYSAMLPQPKVI